MANKAFEVQDSKIRIGGVDLEAGTTGVVIPGVTQATSYKVEEVDDSKVDVVRINEVKYGQDFGGVGYYNIPWNSTVFRVSDGAQVSAWFPNNLGQEVTNNSLYAFYDTDTIAYLGNNYPSWKFGDALPGDLPFTPPEFNVTWTECTVDQQGTVGPFWYVTNVTLANQPDRTWSKYGTPVASTYTFNTSQPGITTQLGSIECCVIGVDPSPSQGVWQGNDSTPFAYSYKVVKEEGPVNASFGNDSEAITVIDSAEFYRRLGGIYTPSVGYVAATYQVDDVEDGDIEEINVEIEGTFSLADKEYIETHNMWATSVVDPLVSFNWTQWTQVPFRPKMRAGEVETIGGGSGGAIVERSVSFPNGEEGDTRGTIALTPDGETYVCTDDWVDASESLQGTFTAVTNELYDINQGGGGFNSASLSIQDEPEIYNILRYGNWSEGELTIDAGPTWGGVQNVVNTGYNDQAGYMTLLWLYRQGDPQEIPLGTSVTITYTGSGNQTPIWRRLVDLTAQGGGEDGEINWRSNGDLTIETIRTNGYTGDCDLNLYGADDVWIEAKGDEAQIRAVNQVSIQVQGDGNWIFQQDGSIALPDLENTGWENGYTLNAPTLMLGGELNNPPQQVVITGPRPNVNNTSAERLIIQGQKGWGGENEPKGEGGDIYLWAGVGGDGGAIDSQGNGGDIKVRGGQGGAGGYVKVEGGDATGPGGTGGYIEITAGDGTNVTSGDGGDVRIKAGSGSGTGNNGEINLYTVGTTNNWIFKNDGALQLPVGGDIRDSNGVSVLGGGAGGAELVGDGYVAGTGFKRTVYTNYQGQQGGESNGELFNETDVNGFAVGDSITFRNGEVRTITSFDTGYSPQVYVQWNSSVDGDTFNNPRYPAVFTSANYVAETKKTARIKPDEFLIGTGQYMEVYAGGPTVLENKHIHMAGANADTELFLGTDNNFVSTKEAGLSPAGVNLKSENDITVSDTNLRMTRGNTWISVYGDSNNTDGNDNNQDLSWDLVETDDQGNFYVGGESHWGPTAMVGKYGPDGDLIWKKLVDRNSTNSWNIQGAAYNPVDKEVAFAFETSINRDYDHAKVTVFDSDTGDVKRTFDIYDPDGAVYVDAMTWHPTLGYMAVGNTSGEMGTTGTLTSTGATGTGIIELPRTSVKIGGQWPSTQGGWRISGTGITGSQTIQAGVGLYYAPVINLTNPSATGMTAGIRVDYSGNYYDNFTTGTPGPDYQSGDNFKILGSSLGGVDGDTTVVATPNSLTPHDNIVSMYFTKTSYPDLYNQLQACSWTAGYNSGGPYNIIAVADAGANWQVDIDSVDTTIDAVSFYTASGNDITGTIADQNGIANGYSGTPSPVAIYHIDMGYNMGYGTTDFTGGTFEITTTLDNTAFVWSDSWSKIFKAENGSSSYAYAMAVDKVYGDIVVGGYDNGSNRNFVWKLDNTGATQWVKRIDEDTNNVYSVAISSVSRDIYFTTGYNSVNKLDSNGNLVDRVEPTGMWGMNNPIVKLEQRLDGEEYLYVGGSYGSAWSNGQNGFMVTKLDSDLKIMWTRSIRNNNRSFYTHYDSFHNNFALGRDKVVLAGYTSFSSFNYDVAFLASITTGDNFDTGWMGQDGEWYLEVLANDITYPNQTSNYAVEDCLVNGAATASSTLQLDTDPNTLALTNWTWKTGLVKLDTTANGIVGVESIAFAEGGLLDHNPSDIPPVVTDFYEIGWNYTLKLSDRGKFIKNGEGIENYTGNLYITVPSNLDLSFPVGSVITLINVSDANSSGNRIYVQPANYSNSDCPKIYATGYGTAWSTWSFQGVQTATLMKIGSNEWLLTANDITNED